MRSILIKNGRVWDGEKFFEADVLVEEGLISKIGTALECPKAFLFDAAGMTVSPGLVDSHVHFLGPEPDLYGINPEMSCIPFGVTAAADAGGAHADKYLADNFLVKNVTFVRVPIKDDNAEFAFTEKRMALYGDKVIGVKVYFDTCKPDVRSNRPLAQICEYAKAHGLKVMVHCSDSPTAMADYLPLLSPGDILSHAYHGTPHNAGEDDFAALQEAKARGIVIDTGNAGHIHTVQCVSPWWSVRSSHVHEHGPCRRYAGGGYLPCRHLYPCPGTGQGGSVGCAEGRANRRHCGTGVRK